MTASPFLLSGEALRSPSFIQNLVRVVDEGLHEAMKQLLLRPETRSHLALSCSYSSKVWLVGDALTGQEQERAEPGAHFVPYSQFPPSGDARADCVYHSTPALMVPESYENLHACGGDPGQGSSTGSRVKEEKDDDEDKGDGGDFTVLSAFFL
uniref:Very-long-chain aldehyde decarbonylase CER1-like C-terminal domain-containing protein n=1 Tax=Aegilops tauschii TaxID=37682 RepID=M8CI45_AEGTA